MTSIPALWYKWVSPWKNAKNWTWTLLWAPFPGFMSRVPGASFSYTVSSAKRVKRSHQPLQNLKVWCWLSKMDKRYKHSNFQRNVWEAHGLSICLITFLCKFWTFRMLVSCSNFTQTAPNFGIVLKPHYSKYRITIWFG